MLSDNVYLDLADYIYFSKNKSLEGLNNKLNELGLEFRKNNVEQRRIYNDLMNKK